MNANSILLRTRVPTERYRNAEKVLHQLGLKPGDAVNMLMAQIEMKQGLPFELAISDQLAMSAEDQMNEWEQAFGSY